MMLSATKEFSHAEHDRLLKVCFKYADVFSLKRAYFTSDDEIKLLEELRPYLLKVIKSCHWFCYYVPERNIMEIQLFRACPETKKILRDHFNRYFYVENELQKSELPEDVSFFRQNKLFMGTVMHEGMCYVYPPTEESAAEFMQICKWDTVKAKPAEQIILRDDYTPIETEWSW